MKTLVEAVSVQEHLFQMKLDKKKGRLSDEGELAADLER
jgi:hypothetical protein